VEIAMQPRSLPALFVALFVGLVVGVVVGLLVGGGAQGVAGLDLFGSAEPAPAEAMVDAALPLRSEGTTYAFTVAKPGPVQLTVQLPQGCQHDADVSLSPVFVAMRPGIVYEPDERPEHRIKVPATGMRDERIELHHAGAYVLRIEPIPMAMGNEGMQPTARVEIRPAK